MKKHKQTGKIVHGDMASLIGGTGTKDPHAHSSHHHHNAKFGMHQGLHPKDDSDSASNTSKGENGMEPSEGPEINMGGCCDND